MLIPLLLHVANLLRKLLDGVFESAVMHLKVWYRTLKLLVLAI